MWRPQQQCPDGGNSSATQNTSGTAWHIWSAWSLSWGYKSHGGSRPQLGGWRPECVLGVLKDDAWHLFTALPTPSTKPGTTSRPSVQGSWWGKLTGCSEASNREVRVGQHASRIPHPRKTGESHGEGGFNDQITDQGTSHNSASEKPWGQFSKDKLLNLLHWTTVIKENIPNKYGQNIKTWT